MQQRFANERFEVVAIALDTGENARAAVHAWHAREGITHLKIYHDPTARIAKTVGATELPATLLLDADGRERGRTNAVLLWGCDAAAAFVREQLTIARKAH